MSLYVLEAQYLTKSIVEVHSLVKLVIRILSVAQFMLYMQLITLDIVELRGMVTYPIEELLVKQHIIDVAMQNMIDVFNLM